jgi:hypothetical protein
VRKEIFSATLSPHYNIMSHPVLEKKNMDNNKIKKCADRGRAGWRLGVL